MELLATLIVGTLTNLSYGLILAFFLMLVLGALHTSFVWVPAISFGNAFLVDVLVFVLSAMWSGLQVDE